MTNSFIDRIGNLRNALDSAVSNLEDLMAFKNDAISELTDARCNLDNAESSLDELSTLNNYLEECLADIEDELHELEIAAKLQKQKTKAPVPPTTDLSPEAIRRELEARTTMAKSSQ